MNITDPIRRFAQVKPGATAVIYGDDTAVSYLDFDRMIDAAVMRLAALGIAAGQTVGLGIVGAPTLVIALALARIGAMTAAVVLPAERMDICLLTRGAEAKPGVRCVSLDETWAQIPPRNVTVPTVAPHVDGSAVCRIFTSSGTTGIPKFAAISHDMLARRVFSNWISMGPSEPVHMCAVGLGITWGFGSVLRTFWSGGTLVLNRTLAAIGRHKVNSIVIAPILLQKLVTAMPDNARPLPSLRAVEVGGSLLPTPLYDLARQKLCGTIVSYYGTTETGGIASDLMRGARGDPRAVGHVHAGIDVEAVDADDRVLPAATEGILRIRSDNNIAGYLDEDESPAHAFKDGWFYPGDLGAVSADRVVTVSGRHSDYINSGGIKLNPHIVEDVLLSLPQVTEAAAFGVPDDMGVVQVWAAIVAESRIEISRLKAICDEKLLERSPKFIVQVKELPRNANGKVVRDELVKSATALKR
jgi:acyl-coenzyme A synthetase/AMP-(fatty) acid ligase